MLRLLTTIPKDQKNRPRVIFWRKSPLLLVGQDGALSHIFEGGAHIACEALKQRKAFLNMPPVVLRRKPMFRKVWIYLAASLILVISLVAGNPLIVVEGHQAAQDGENQGRAAAEKKYAEAGALLKQGTAESIRLAAQKYEEALPLWRAISDRAWEGLTLAYIGKVYDSLGEPRKSLDYYKQALKLFRAIGNRDGEATMLDNIGAVHQLLGEPRKALEFHNQALEIRRAIGDRDGEAKTINNIGYLYNSLGEPRKALDYYNRALKLHREVGDREGETGPLTNIGQVYHSLGENRKALEFHNQALEICRAVGSRGYEATTLNSIGLIHASQGDKQIEWKAQ
jgi:tetratricopeptide (TPR) repeat protein